MDRSREMSPEQALVGLLRTFEVHREIADCKGDKVKELQVFENNRQTLESWSRKGIPDATLLLQIYHSRKGDNKQSEIMSDLAASQVNELPKPYLEAKGLLQGMGYNRATSVLTDFINRIEPGKAVHLEDLISELKHQQQKFQKFEKLGGAQPLAGLGKAAAERGKFAQREGSAQPAAAAPSSRGPQQSPKKP